MEQTLLTKDIIKNTPSKEKGEEEIAQLTNNVL